jgi:IS30 family transposase
MRSWKHLTISDRRVIKIFLYSGKKKKKIAEELEVSRSRISYEIKMNSKPDGEYDPDYAQELYEKRRSKSKKESKLTKDIRLFTFVVECLQMYWSPEQISGILLKKHKNSGMYISPESIYQHIYYGALGRSFIYYLRQSKKSRQKRGQKTSKRVIIKDKKNIRERPEPANKGNRIGDWEGDTVVGKNNQGYIATFVDRKSSYFKAALMNDKEAQSLNKAASQAFWDIENKNIKTITVDNGTEFAEFKNLEELFNTQVYFADPYSSWQRGLNENTNGLLRQFFPKNTNFKKVTEEELERVIDLLNHRPRKKLGFLTPHEVFIKKKFVLFRT